MNIAEFVDDDIKLGRIVPYFVDIASGSSGKPMHTAIRSAAVEILTCTLACVKDVSLQDSNIFSVSCTLGVLTSIGLYLFLSLKSYLQS
jgi:hypothetical protein